jgi:hypothetical protein
MTYVLYVICVPVTILLGMGVWHTIRFFFGLEDDL